MSDKNYEKSNKVVKLARLSKLKSATKKLYQKLREAGTVKETELCKLANMICGDLKVAPVSVAYSGRQPHSTSANAWTGKTRINKKTLGQYSTGMHVIRIFKHTAVQKKEITAKVALDTLLHELCHHFDYEIVKLNKSIHSSGFYKRIGSLSSALS